TVHELNRRGIAHENNLLEFRKTQLNDSTHHTNLLTTTFAVVAVAIIMLAFFSNMLISQKSKRLEGLLESILNTSQNAIVHYKAIKEHGKITDFYVEYANNAVKELFYVFPEDIIGRQLKSLPTRTPMMYEKFVEIMEKGKPQAFEYLYNNGQDTQWIYASLSKTDNGITGTFHNITPIKKYEEELKENIKDLERSNTELEQYAYVASHDLQEPLRKIRSFGSYLQDTQTEYMDAKGKEQLDKIMGAAERMSVLIKDILSFSSLSKQELFVPVDLNKILQAVIHDLDLVITQNEAQIKNDVLPIIEAIPLQMNQLFYNLLNNSLKFNKPGQKTVIQLTCRAIHESEKHDDLLQHIPYYELVFSDNGIGFSQDYSEQIFGLFKRLNDRLIYPGSGIGLALCKKVVENHNGAIFAKSSEQEGASFYIYLPVRQG
ncbi:MAG: ATP-binding protein, partial [Flavisolibacter sp.]